MNVLAGDTVTQAIILVCWATGLGLLRPSLDGRLPLGAIIRSLLAALTGIATYAALGFVVIYGCDIHVTASVAQIASQAMGAGAAAAVAAGGFDGRVRGWAQPLGWGATALVYAVVADWTRGGGWLNEIGFYDAIGGIVIVGLGGAVAVGAGLVRRSTPTESDDEPAGWWKWGSVPLLAAVVGPAEVIDGELWMRIGWVSAAAAVVVAIAASLAAGLAIRHAPQARWCAAAVVMAWCVAAAVGESVEPTTAAGLGFLAGVLGPMSHTSARLLGIADRAGVAGPAVDGATLAAIVVAIAHEEGSWAAQMTGLLAILGVGVLLGAAVAVVFRGGGVRDQA